MIAYPIMLGIISLIVAGLERGFPWRPKQKTLRPGLVTDVLHLLLNGHFLGVILFAIAARFWVSPEWHTVATAWPLWAQAIAAIVLLDLLQWCVHNTLHRVPFLWSMHKLHHSVRDGQMDWFVAFRFQWTEVVFYKAAMAIPLAWLGFSIEAMWIQAVVGTVIGHLNHANLPWTYGPFRYILNSPAMHIWHHDHDGPARNFGIVLSCWDWIFGTATMPDHPPAKLGYAEMDELPQGFFAQQVWQLGAWVPALKRTPLTLNILGSLLLLAGWLAAS